VARCAPVNLDRYVGIEPGVYLADYPVLSHLLEEFTTQYIAMRNILLTGAGFSRNWGGWLANEAFEYLLGCPEVDAPLRDKLWLSKNSGGGFEDALAALQSPQNAEEQRQLDNLTAALIGMFNAMGQGFMYKTFEPQQDINRMVRTFLMNFDAIFTLNQDTLLEQHYFDDNIMLGSAGKWYGWELPGMPFQGQVQTFPAIQQSIAVRSPAQTYSTTPRFQPYYKLHGSANWVDDKGRILIMGGNKVTNMDRYPILVRYKAEFERQLLQPDAKLMVIGYSFGDKHINDAIEAGICNGLKLFIIDPGGVDVLDKKAPGEAVPDPRTLRQRYQAGMIGASRRQLTSIFNDDLVEHTKVMGFLR
jgi:hypothetical protein